MVATTETFEEIHDSMLAGRRLKVHESVETVSISHDSIVSILNDHLDMGKQSARRMSRFLKIDNTRNHLRISKESKLDEFLHPFHSRKRNMDSPKYSGDLAAIKMWEFLRVNRPQERQGKSVSQQSHRNRSTSTSCKREEDDEYDGSLFDQFNDDLKRKQFHFQN